MCLLVQHTWLEACWHTRALPVAATVEKHALTRSRGPETTSKRDTHQHAGVAPEKCLWRREVRLTFTPVTPRDEERKRRNLSRECSYLDYDLHLCTLVFATSTRAWDTPSKHFEKEAQMEGQAGQR